MTQVGRKTQLEDKHVVHYDGKSLGDGRCPPRASKKQLNHDRLYGSPEDKVIKKNLVIHLQSLI